jgi:hypothetical protein
LQSLVDHSALAARKCGYATTATSTEQSFQFGSVRLHTRKQLQFFRDLLVVTTIDQFHKFAVDFKVFGIDAAIKVAHLPDLPNKSAHAAYTGILLRLRTHCHLAPVVVLVEKLEERLGKRTLIARLQQVDLLLIVLPVTTCWYKGELTLIAISKPTFRDTFVLLTEHFPPFSVGGQILLALVSRATFVSAELEAEFSRHPGVQQKFFSLTSDAPDRPLLFVQLLHWQDELVHVVDQRKEVLPVVPAEVVSKLVPLDGIEANYAGQWLTGVRLLIFRLLLTVVKVFRRVRVTKSPSGINRAATDLVTFLLFEDDPVAVFVLHQWLAFIVDEIYEAGLIL